MIDLDRIDTTRLLPLSSLLSFLRRILHWLVVLRNLPIHDEQEKRKETPICVPLNQNFQVLRLEEAERWLIE